MKLLLVLVALTGIAAVIGAIVVGSSTFDGVVVDKPYDRGLTWDAEQNKRSSSGWVIEIEPSSPRIGSNNLMIAVTDRTGQPLDAIVLLSISRPSSPVYDKQYPTERTAKGSYEARVDLPLYGYWNLDIQVTAQNNTVSFRRTVFAEQEHDQ